MNAIESKRLAAERIAEVRRATAGEVARIRAIEKAASKAERRWVRLGLAADKATKSAEEALLDYNALVAELRNGSAPTSTVRVDLDEFTPVEIRGARQRVRRMKAKQEATR